MTLGAVVQGASGVGGGFIMVPLLAMINVAFLPGALVCGSLSISGFMSWRERTHIDFRCVAFLLVAFVPGSLAGAWLFSTIAPDKLGVFFGSVILFAVFISFLGVQFPLNRISATVAGVVTGVMGASTGIGAPVLALLYQRSSGPAVRSTLAFLYTACSLMIVAALMVFDGFGVEQLKYALILVPGFMLGYVLSRPLAVYFDHGATRYVVLGVSAVASLSLIVGSA